MNFQRLVTKVLEKICQRRVVIRDSVLADRPAYMIRYILVKNPWFSIYAHRFLRSDIDTHHDHPWNFFTLVLAKGYVEEIMEPDQNRGLLAPRTVRRAPWSLAYRKAETIHRVMLPRNYLESEQLDAPLTICLMLRRRRVWGFIEQIEKGDLPTLPRGGRGVTGHMWTNWKDYLGISPQDPRYFGSE